MKFGTGLNAEQTQKYGGSTYKMTYVPELGLIMITIVIDYKVLRNHNQNQVTNCGCNRNRNHNHIFVIKPIELLLVILAVK